MCKHVGVSSWFSELLPANDSFVTDERLVWVSVEGLPSKSWTHNTFAKIVSQWGSLSDVEEDGVYIVRVKELEVWFPEFNCQFSDNGSDKGASDDEILGNHGINGECNTDNEVDYVSESSCMKDDGVASEHVDKSHNAKSPSEDPFGIYDILNRKPDNSNHKSDDPTFPPGFTPADENVIPMNSKDDNNDKPKGDFQSNKEGQSSSKSVNTSILKIKSGGSILDVMESVVEIGQTMGYNMGRMYQEHGALMVIKEDFRFPSVGNSGGIVCVWDLNMFVKDNVSISDSFVAIRGTWVPTATKLLIVSVYAPQEVSERRLLWEYIGSLIEQWEGACAILGVFNEVVRSREGYSHLSDHRPILMREVVVDYGPTPFRIFNSWFSKAGFDKMVESSWNNSLIMENNAIVLLKKKFQALKSMIKSWSKQEKHQSSAQRTAFMNRLVELDKIIDQGSGTENLVHERTVLLKDIYKVNSRLSLDFAQKAKVRWSIEGDENSKYFHGILNKKRSQLAIRGVLVDGDWIVEDMERNVSYDEIIGIVIDKEVVISCGGIFFTLALSPPVSRWPFYYNENFIVEQRQEGLRAMIFRLTLKGFDSVRWDFLDDLLDKFSFGTKWRGWIKGCLNSAGGSIPVMMTPVVHWFIKAMYGDHGCIDSPGTLIRNSPWSIIIKEVAALSLKGFLAYFGLVQLYELGPLPVLIKWDYILEWQDKPRTGVVGGGGRTYQEGAWGESLWVAGGWWGGGGAFGPSCVGSLLQHSRTYASRMTGQVFECILLLGTLRDISWLLEPSLVLTPHCGLKEYAGVLRTVRGGNTLTILLPFEEGQAELKLFSKLDPIMSGTVPPIPPPLGTSSGNTGNPNPNRVDTMPTNDIPNTTPTTNAGQNVGDENLPQLLDSRGGSHVTNVPDFDKDDFTSWKVRFLCKTAKEMWNDLILAHEGPSDTRDTKIAALRLKFNAFKSLEGEKPTKKMVEHESIMKKDSNSDVEEDQRTNNEFMADLNAEYHERAMLENQNSNHQKDYKEKYKGLKAEMAVLTKRIDDLTKGKSEKGKNEKGKSEKGLIAESFDWDEESVSSEDEGTTRIRAFMAIAEDEPSIGKADARSGQ
ncbi:hypothetical protein Tco_1057919 [Tanacetum coccineum]|uniref:RNA-directed DNA polymerase, eukaryota n=1 Tax=Tanacetum coccineum TaxID=301880 RepID=A0ABQ5H8J2_9ASTR